MQNTPEGQRPREEGGLGLPPWLEPNDFASAGEWLDAVYAQYRAIVHDARIRLFGLPVCALERVSADGRDAAFWHTITDASTHGHRRLNLRRAAMLGQVWHLLELLAAGDPRACCWNEHTRGRRRLVVAPVDFSMHVVLSETRSALQFVTAYPVARRHRNRPLLAVVEQVPQRPRHPKWRRPPMPFAPPARHLLVEGRRLGRCAS